MTQNPQKNRKNNRNKVKRSKVFILYLIFYFSHYDDTQFPLFNSYFILQIQFPFQIIIIFSI